MLTGHSPLLGMIKPSKHSVKSHAELRSMLPGDIRTIERFAPTQHGTLEEFQNNLPVYERFARELAEAGVDLIHVEGTPVSFILGREREGETIDRWQQEFGIPVFTSATCQVNALHALGATKIVDAGYDPTTGPPAERYFSAAGFTVLHVEKVPVAWAGSDEIADDQAFDMLANLVRRYPGSGRPLSAGQQQMGSQCDCRPARKRIQNQRGSSARRALLGVDAPARPGGAAARPRSAARDNAAASIDKVSHPTVGYIFPGEGLHEAE